MDVVIAWDFHKLEPLEKGEDVVRCGPAGPLAGLSCGLCPHPPISELRCPH